MFEYLEQLRNTSYAFRKRMAVVIASIITGIIVVVWISTFNMGTIAQIDEKGLERELRPFQEIKESAASFFPFIKEMSASLFGFGTSTSAR